MAQYDKGDSIQMTTHFGCTTADGYITDSSIVRYKPDGVEDISVEEAIRRNHYEAGENVDIEEGNKISVSFDFGTYD